MKLALKSERLRDCLKLFPLSCFARETREAIEIGQFTAYTFYN